MDQVDRSFEDVGECVVYKRLQCVFTGTHLKKVVFEVGTFTDRTDMLILPLYSVPFDRTVQV